MHLRLEQAIVREWRSDDLRSLVPQANNPRVSRWLRDGFPYPYEKNDAEDFLTVVAGQQPPTFFCIASGDDDVIGGIGFMRHNDIERFNAEIGYWLAESHWGQGITCAVLKAVTEQALTAHGLIRLYATPFADNAASIRVLEKAGYQLEGRLRRAVVKAGVLQDALMYAYTREPTRALLEGPI